MNEQITASVEEEIESQFRDVFWLSEVNHLNRYRDSRGDHQSCALEGVYTNLIPAVKEASMPFAVSPTYQEFRDGSYWWLDQTSEEVARTGYRFHRHEAALARVDVEVDEAQDIVDRLTPGVVKVVISPRMSRTDAPYTVAKDEHLGDDDMIRLHQLDVDDFGNTRGKYMESLLVRDIPLEAWIALLHDPNNMFGKAIEVEDETSALSVMKVHRELYVSPEQVPEGVISIVAAVLPYLDTETQDKVKRQLVLFRSDQQTMHENAEFIAQRWLSFEVALADSIHTGKATDEVTAFIRELAFEWSQDFLDLLEEHTLPNGTIRMTRELAAEIEQARRNTLWISSAVLAENNRVLDKISHQTQQKIYNNTLLMKMMVANNYDPRDIAAIEAQNNRLIAHLNIGVGGGCPGDVLGAFGDEGLMIKQFKNQTSMSNERKKWKWKPGICERPVCPNHRIKKVTLVGPCGVCCDCQDMFDEEDAKSIDIALELV